MALVHRDGRPYCYRSVRRGGRVTSKYRAAGLLAVAMEGMERIDREEHQARRAAERSERERWEAVERPLIDLFGRVEEVARQWLERNGYHRHDRGPWRKRRMNTATPAPLARNPIQEQAPNNAPPDATAALLARDVPATRAEICALRDRARKGDASAMPALRRLLDVEPDAFGNCGEIAHLAELGMLKAAGDDLLAKELMARDLARIASDLAGSNPSPIERLLARRAALCWFAVHSYEALLTSSDSQPTITQATFHHRRIDRAHHRLLSALRTLAAVRRVPLTAVQINVGHVGVPARA